MCVWQQNSESTREGRLLSSIFKNSLKQSFHYSVCFAIDVSGVFAFH